MSYLSHPAPGNHKEVKIAVTKWVAGGGKAWVDDVYMKKAQ